MYLTTTLRALALLSSHAVYAQEATRLDTLHPRQTDSNCSDIHFIVARGSTQSQIDGSPPGAGPMGAVAVDVCAQHANCTAYGLVYPATLDNYKASEAAGTAAMMLATQQYYESCPQTPIVLMGYSQGAQVVGDVLCGTSEAGWPVTNAIDGPVIDNVLAAILMGDPTYTPSLPYSLGTANHTTLSSIFPRQNTTACLRFSDRIQSYCDNNDKYCAGGDSLVVHVGYVAEYGGDAVRFVMSKLDSWTKERTTRGASDGLPAGTGVWKRLGYAVVGTSLLGASVFGVNAWRARSGRGRYSRELELK